MIKLGLLGKNISHSRSKEMYESLLGEEVDYKLIDIDKKENVPLLNSYFEQYSLMGLSITYPYKQHFLEEVIINNETIKSLRAINCIEKRDGLFYATNTDYLAALYLLEERYFNEYTSFILLGSGNMAKVFSAAFKKHSREVKFLSRKNNGDLNKVDYRSLVKDKNTLIINTCSREFEFNPSKSVECGFWDMNYSFEPHRKLEKNGMIYHEGLDLLREQGKFALKFWKMGHLIKNQCNFSGKVSG